jgi:DNA-binding NtrC family response regulator
MVLEIRIAALALISKLVVSVDRSQRMKSQAILVLGNHANGDLVQTLLSAGFVPQMWGSVLHSLEKLRRRRFAAVIVDRKFTHADVLEFILNVRDINQQIPVVVIGRGKDERIDAKIRRQDRTMILNGAKRSDTLAERLFQALERNWIGCPESSS